MNSSNSILSVINPTEACSVSPDNIAETISPAGQSPRWLDRRLRSVLQSRLAGLRDGIVEIRDVDGSHPLGRDGDTSDVVSIDVRNPAFYRRLATSGALGAAESFINGEWATDDLVGLLRLLARNIDTFNASERGVAQVSNKILRLAAHFQRNTKAGSRRNIEAHYDLGNEFFELFLDPTMMYSSACFDRPDATLEEASRSKLHRICRRLQIQPGDHILEIGTGWGGFAEFAAQNYGCRITTTTISSRQHEYAKRRFEKSRVANLVTLLKQDYRNLEGQFDKLVSIEMIEAVGHEFLDTYFSQCDRLLKPGGRMVIQSITMPEQRFASYQRSVDFIQKYIFPGGFLPSIATIQESAGRVTDLRLVGVEDFAPSYARTLHEWRSRFFDRIEDIKRMGFSDRFVRTWDYYFSYCEAAFLERAVGLAQLEWVKV